MGQWVKWKKLDYYLLFKVIFFVRTAITIACVPDSSFSEDLGSSLPENQDSGMVHKVSPINFIIRLLHQYSETIIWYRL